MTSKLARTILIILILAMPILLWLFKTEQLQSLSAYAMTAGVVAFYRAMHVFGSWLFLIEGQKFKRHIDMVTGVSMGMILIFDMYLSQIVHNIFTASTVLLALISIIYYSSKKYLGTNILIAVCAAVSFILGLTLPMKSSILWGEFFSMFCIAVSRARRVWINENA